jgi:hypothetical protein
MSSRTKYQIAVDTGYGWKESFIHGSDVPLPEGVQLEDFFAYNAAPRLHLCADMRDLAGEQRQRAT